MPALSRDDGFPLLPRDYEMNDLYVELKVWKRLNDQAAVLYRCFKSLEDEKFAVQSADFFRLPIDERQIHNSARQFFELLIEVAPSQRCAWFESLDEAIAAHDRDFS